MPFAKRSAFRRPARKKTRRPPFALSFFVPDTGNAPARKGARRARHTGAEGRNRPLHPPVRGSRSPGPGRPIRPRDERRSPSRHGETGRRPQQNRLRKGSCAPGNTHPGNSVSSKRLPPRAAQENRFGHDRTPINETGRPGDLPRADPYSHAHAFAGTGITTAPPARPPRPGHGDSSRHPLSLPGPKP